MASEVLDDYKNDVADAITMVDSLSGDDNDKEKLVENIAVNLELLDAVSELPVVVDEVKSEVVELAKEAGMENVEGGVAVELVGSG